jgi:serine/threonine-protein kinase
VQKHLLHRGKPSGGNNRADHYCVVAVPGYKILGVLGRGGMGVVYKAQLIKVQRIVALKMILGGSHADQDQLARFRTEAEAVARLQHPNVVQIFEVGEPQGLPFFSMEFCEGGSHKEQLADDRLTAKEAAALVRTLATAMAANTPRPSSFCDR